MSTDERLRLDLWFDLKPERSRSADAVASCVADGLGDDNVYLAWELRRYRQVRDLMEDL